MKRSLLILSALCLPFRIYGQGFISFNNYGTDSSTFAPVYGPETVDPTLQLWGNSADGYPPGTQVYSGAPLLGTGYSVQGWYSWSPPTDLYALNTSASVLPDSLSSFNLGGGYFGSVGAYIPNATGTRSGVYLQVRAWDNAGGQYTTWDQAWNVALAGSGNAIGWSKVFWQTYAQGASLPPGLANLESFNIFVVPEPSSFALFGLGGLSLWFFQRRK